MVIHSALVRSHQSASARVASASCVPRGYNTARLSRVRPSIKRKPDVRGAHTIRVFLLCPLLSRSLLSAYRITVWPVAAPLCLYLSNKSGHCDASSDGDGFKVVCVGWKSKKARFSPGAPHPKKGRCSPEKQESKIFAGQAPPPKGPRLSRNRTQKAQESKIFCRFIGPPQKVVTSQTARFFPGGLALRFSANGGPAAPMPIGP